MLNRRSGLVADLSIASVHVYSIIPTALVSQLASALNSCPQSTGPAVVRMEKGVEWLGVVRREKGVEWLGVCREEGEGG